MVSVSVCRPLSPFYGFHTHQPDRHGPAILNATAIPIAVGVAVFPDHVLADAYSARKQSDVDCENPEKELIRRVVNGDQRARNWFQLRCTLYIDQQLKASCTESESGDAISTRVLHLLFENDCHRLRNWLAAGRRRLVSFVRAQLRKVMLDWSTSAPARSTEFAHQEFRRLDGCSNVWRSTLPEILNGTVGDGAAQPDCSKLQRRAAHRSLAMLLRRDSEILRRSYILKESCEQVSKTMLIAPSAFPALLATAEKRFKTKLAATSAELFV